MASGITRLEKNLLAAVGADAGNLSVTAGFYAQATYPDGTSVALVAAVNEYGAPSRGQPPRPFMRDAVRKYGPTWPDALAAALKQTGGDAEKAMNAVGLIMASQIQDSIQSLTSPPLSPRTVRGKGFDKPLIDTGVMLRSVGHLVEKS